MRDHHRDYVSHGDNNAVIKVQLGNGYYNRERDARKYSFCSITGLLVCPAGNVYLSSCKRAKAFLDMPLYPQQRVNFVNAKLHILLHCTHILWVTTASVQELHTSNHYFFLNEKMQV